MNNELKQSILNGEIILFLGSGASRGSKTQSGENLPVGFELAKLLAEKAGFEYENEELSIVYSAAKKKMGAGLDKVMEEQFRFCKSSPEYTKLATYPWRRIYTLNIDDSLEIALIRSDIQNINIRLGADPINNRDPFFEKLDYIKLNGSVTNLQNGVIFSAAEYAKSTSGEMPWYEEVAVDFVQSKFIFIGTKLNEPLLKYHIERYKKTVGNQSGTSYVITPSATEMEKIDLQDYNLLHLAGTFEEFIEWLTTTLPNPPKPIELAISATPQLRNLLKSNDPLKYAHLFEGVTHVNRSNIAALRQKTTSDAIRSFYKGFKPTWKDIGEQIPAELDQLALLRTFINSHGAKGKLLPITGPSGSGKSTLVMQVAYQLSDEPNTNVFYIDGPIEDIEATLEEIDRSNRGNSCFVAINDLDIVSDQLVRSLSSGRLKNIIIFGSERAGIWNQRTKTKLNNFCTASFHVKEFTESDASKILIKLEKYGQWTRLGKMSEKDRLSELVTRSKRQLLIALLEATSGRGFEEIIASEYNSLTTTQERVFFLIVGLATVHRRNMPLSLLERALGMGSLQFESAKLISNLEGIVIQHEGGLIVRHPTYIRYLLSNIVDPSLIEHCIKILLQAFSLYESPVVKHAPKKETAIYKAVVNHKFLFEVLKGNYNAISGLYESLEKRFENDGLYWLQYGLFLRDFNFHDDALEKLRIACDAHRMEHTEHALAQQLLITAAQLTDKHKAYAYMEEAKTILDRLDKTLSSDDTYPLVTLAEGHTIIVKQFEGDEPARDLAKKYAETLKRRFARINEESRLKESYDKLFRYALTGTWNLNKNFDLHKEYDF